MRMILLSLLLVGCSSRRPHVSWPTETPVDDARWRCEAHDPHNSAKDCVKKAFHYRKTK